MTDTERIMRAELDPPKTANELEAELLRLEEVVSVEMEKREAARKESLETEKAYDEASLALGITQDEYAAALRNVASARRTVQAWHVNEARARDRMTAAQAANRLICDRVTALAAEARQLRNALYQALRDVATGGSRDGK